ncbi:hypothetical protein [Gordonia otitidis]|uniref:Secreted protein n=1 Tax=Gordonia otitidis (strain DSM 44809 / CCUG 52243 / JCM 12355 / NBRC 100426 / IFM 10032) TaxID=1108044 RepID=H5TQE4_GORO1|nr:hypothetical protein [Gordonia otitidis]GAB35702.1 hypothetical protein GOOTI_179_00080 [Gordonia otitidis NBRC 100426]
MKLSRVSSTLVGLGLAMTAAVGLGAGTANAAPAKPFQSFTIGQELALGSSCVGRATGNVLVQPNRGHANIDVYWIGQTPFSPCTERATVRWYNLNTHRSGFVGGPLTYRSMSQQGVASADVFVGSGPVRFTLTADRPLQFPPAPFTLVMP